ncbi:hypothetical protein PRIPAC_78797 [Pristionchus pacificus]|uniref:Endo/exonuclease/phosphatase domain-containing protein n=1 Tax=Pristionchus pacificus TaxID=54126 RepID=A0A2A6C2M7_PRIPA|nr:hypothetical protein PRIPAC_78797 [Pristionchus pacificus]|eukprot:PDM72347.1 hypothetical protein PRIPAC_38781 [Pristionchus pacificus]
MIKQRNIDLFALTETWLGEMDCDAFLLRGMPDYFVFRADRRWWRSYLCSLSYASCPCIVSCGFECVTIDIFSSSSIKAHNCIRIIYRAPNSPASETPIFVDYFTQVTSCVHTSIIIGDFNYPSIDWYTYSSPTSSVTPFLDFVSTKAFNQFVDFPTRGKNILDLVLSNSPIISTVKPDIPLSDHVGISVTISFDSARASFSAPTRNFALANWDMINAYIASHDWTIALSNKTATEAYFSKFMNSLLEAFVPLKKPKSSSGYPKFLSTLHDRLQRLHSVAPNSDSTHALRARFNQALKTFEIKRDKNAIQSRNANLFFQYCKSRFKHSSSSLPGIVGSNGVILLTNQDKATAFSKFFSKVQTPPMISPLPLPPPSNASFDIPFISLEQILTAISQLVPKCAVLHLGRIRSRSTYSLIGCVISPRNEIRDFGVFFNTKFHFEHHIEQITRKARSIDDVHIDSHPPSSGTAIGLVNRLESVQREFTRRILWRSHLPYLPYPQRLEHFQLETLEYRRALNDMFSCLILSMDLFTSTPLIYTRSLL